MYDDLPPPFTKGYVRMEFESGKQHGGYDRMVVMYDEFDGESTVEMLKPGEPVPVCGPHDMLRPTEVFDLSKDFEEQFNRFYPKSIDGARAIMARCRGEEPVKT